MDSSENETNSTSQLRKLAWSSLRQGDYSSALRSFNVLIKAPSPNCADYTGLGLASGGVNDWRRAARSLGKAYSFKPGSVFICTNFLRALLQHGKLSTALLVIGNKQSVVPYKLSSFIMSKFAKSPEAVELINKMGWLDLYLKLLKFLDIEPAPDRIASFIAANALFPTPWREKALDYASDEEIAEWVTWQGADRLTELLDQGRGVILLHSHFVVGRSASLLLARKGYQIHGIEFRDRLGEFGIRSAERMTSITVESDTKFYLRQVHKAKTVLDKGGIFKLAGDGYFGQSEVKVDFFGREHPFRTGFADLALISKVPVIPVFCTVDLSGKILIDIFPPLDAGAEIAARHERIRHLVQQYAILLEQKWRSDPHNITWQHLKMRIKEGLLFT